MFIFLKIKKEENPSKSSKMKRFLPWIVLRFIKYKEFKNERDIQSFAVI